VWASAQETSTAQSATQTPVTGTLWSANESIGAEVISATGENLGSVEDIVLDWNASRIAYVIVSYGGLLGLGDKHFAVPWQAFSQTADRALLLDMNPEQLKNAPGFEKGTLPNMSDPLFHETVYSFYNTKPYTLAEQQKEARAEAQERADERAFDWKSWVNRGEDTTWARRLGELIGTNVENAQGETIAELEDVIVDSREARAAYAVVSHGGTLGFFADTAIIPWNVLRLDLAREAYVTGVTLGQLEQATLSDTKYRILEDRKYSEALYGTFGTKPYWEEFGYEAMKERAARTAEVKAEADVARDAVDTAANELNSNTVTGTVVSVSSYPGATPQAESQRGVRVRVRTESGATRTVHLASIAELQQKALTLNRSDKVVITGENRVYRGHNVFYAHMVQTDGKTFTFDK